MSSISLVSLNIERSKHLDLVEAFLVARMPEVLCVQELCDRDIPRMAATLGDATCLFLPMYHDTDAAVTGVGIFSRLPVTQSMNRYYHGSENSKRIDRTSMQTRSSTQAFGIASCTVGKEEMSFAICTTHFTWTPDGEPDDYQRADLQAMLRELATLDEFVLAGDFNAPRGGEIFTAITEHYKDNIPAKYATSIDIDLHRAGKTRPQELADKMVDGLFTTPGYKASDVELVPGVSDHCAVVAKISKK